MDCKHFSKSTIGNPCRGCLLTEIERLEAEKEGLLKHFRLINGTVTCHNLKKIKKLREALEKAREHEQSWLENGAYDGKEDGTVKLLKAIDKALKGNEGVGA